MDKIKSLKVKQADGTLGPAIALGADAANVDMADGSTVEAAMAKKQAKLVSGTNIKTINNNSILGSGNINLVTDLSNYYNKTEINDLIGKLSSLNIEVVTTLPTANISSSTIYLVARENGDTQNVYEEYIYVNNKWEMIGTTEIDTSSFDEVHVGSDTPTADSVEIWIDPNGEASEGNADAYTKTETDAKIAEAMYNVNNIIKLDSSLGSTTLKPILKHIVDTIEENEKEAPLVTVINSNNSTSKHVVYGYSNKYTDGAYTNYKFNGTMEVGYSSETAKGSYVKRSEYYLIIRYNPSTDTYSFTPGKSTYNSDTFLPTGNQNVSGFTPTYAYHPATKKYVDEYSYSKAEIDAKFTALASQYIKQVNGTTTALWMGTKAQYDAITTKDATTTYIIQGTTE